MFGGSKKNYELKTLKYDFQTKLPGGRKKIRAKIFENNNRDPINGSFFRFTPSRCSSSMAWNSRKKKKRKKKRNGSWRGAAWNRGTRRVEREKGRAKGFSDNVTGEKQAKALRAAFPSAIQAKCDRLLSIKRRNTVVPLRFRLFFDSTPRRE